MSFAHFAFTYITEQLSDENIEKFHCLITHELMATPVFYILDSFKYVFEKDVIERWQKKNGTCPITRKSIADIELKRDFEMEDAIYQLQSIQHFLLKHDEKESELSIIEKDLAKEDSFVKEYMTTQFLKAIKKNDLQLVAKFEPVIPQLINEVDGNGWGAIHFVVTRGLTELFEYLLKFKPSLTLATKNNYTPIFWAISAVQPEMVELLINAGVKVGISSLPSFLFTDRPTEERVDKVLAIIRMLLKQGVTLNSDPDGMSPLHYMVLRYYPHTAFPLLIRKGANVNAQDEKGNTPLHYAALEKYQYKLVKTLLQLGANPLIMNDKGLTAKEECEKYRASADYLNNSSCFDETLKLLNFYEKASSKTRADDQEEQLIALKKELETEKSQRMALAEKQQFLLFVNKFNMYNASHVKKSPTMTAKILNGEVTTMAEVQKYAAEHPKSPTAKVLEKCKSIPTIFV